DDDRVPARRQAHFRERKKHKLSAVKPGNMPGCSCSIKHQRWRTYMAKTSSKSENMSMNDGVQSVERALDLLELLARSSDSMGISQLSAATGQPVGTVHRLLMTLVARGYVMRDSRNRRYALGSTARMLANANSQRLNCAEIAAPFLRQLVELSGETANIVVMEQDKAVYLAQVQSTRMVRMFTELGNRV